MSATLTQTTALPGAAASAPHAAARGQAGKARPAFSFGKYREIIVAVGFFLLFDLGVLVLNFYTSFQIAQDAVGINLAGRQRMLSQRTAKAMLAVEAARLKGVPADQEMVELNNAVRLFDATLKGFQHGATVPGGDSQPVLLRAAEGAKAADILSRAQAIWTPYQQHLAPVLAATASDQALQQAVDYARAHNLQLLGLMNELTTALEAVASDRANTLRQVQTGGIVLALLNFAFILFKFLRRLRTSDAAIEAANEENHEILVSVREGLFLLTPEFRLGSQLSRSAHELFGRMLRPGDHFFDLLEPLVSDKALRDGRDYVELLFSPHVKEALVQGINPLSEVQVAVRNRLGQDQHRYLSFHFNRVQQDQTVRHLLVTVQDITPRIALEQRLEGERQRSQKEFGMLLKAIEADPALLRQFVLRAESKLLQINDLLRSTSHAHGEAAILGTLDAAGRLIHAVKGDAATLGLDTLASQAHQFESELQGIRDAGLGDNLGNALLALPMPLEELLNKVSSLKSLTALPRQGPSLGTGNDTHNLNEALARLARQIASDRGIQVAPAMRLSKLANLGERTRGLLHEITVQLIRNAMVHGIESPEQREQAGKSPEGRIDAELLREGADWALTVRDDGAGLDVERVRSRLLELGWYSPPQLESFDDRQIVAHIFKPGFSTADGLSEHAGRGIGLDLVQAHVQQLGARLTLRSTRGQFTEFTIRFTA